VGSYAPNKLGLYDMHGNVWQWTDSLWRKKGKKGSFQVLRGGGWHNLAGSCQAAYRSTYEPDWHDDTRFESIGFRLARVPVR
jgi:formylglycine-generating enzyme required for sulfatase activity